MSLITICAFLFGFVFLLALLGTAWYIIGRPSGTDVPAEAMFILRVILALAGGATIGSIIPGFLDIKIEGWQKITIHATGAVAAFVMIYLINPPKLVKKKTQKISKPRKIKVPQHEIEKDNLIKEVQDDSGTQP